MQGDEPDTMEFVRHHAPRAAFVECIRLEEEAHILMRCGYSAEELTILVRTDTVNREQHVVPLSALYPPR